MHDPVTIDDQAYLAPSWSEMGEATVALAKKIKGSRKSYDRIIALAKGGWGWARQLQDLLGIKNLASVQISFYTHIGQTKKSPVVIQSLPISVAGESILVYDDVVDSGETIALAKDYLIMHGAAIVDTATHFTKSWTKINPTFSAGSTDAWIIFPHDSFEMIKLLQEKWAGVEDAKLKQRLEKIGIESSIIDLALNPLK